MEPANEMLSANRQHHSRNLDAKSALDHEMFSRSEAMPTFVRKDANAAAQEGIKSSSSQKVVEIDKRRRDTAIVLEASEQGVRRMVRQ